MATGMHMLQWVIFGVCILCITVVECVVNQKMSARRTETSVNNGLTDSSGDFKGFNRSHILGPEGRHNTLYSAMSTDRSFARREDIDDDEDQGDSSADYSTLGLPYVPHIDVCNERHQCDLHNRTRHTTWCQCDELCHVYRDLCETTNIHPEQGQLPIWVTLVTM